MSIIEYESSENSGVFPQGQNIGGVVKRGPRLCHKLAAELGDFGGRKAVGLKGHGKLLKLGTLRQHWNVYEERPSGKV